MHFKQNNKESKTYVQGLRSFGNTLPRGVKQILKKNGYNYSEIISKWSILVGKDIASYCYPKSIKMTNGGKNGILILSVKRGNEINVEYSKRDIVNRVNSYFGYKLINNIRLQAFNSLIKKKKEKNVANKHTIKFSKKINEIENKNIRDSLLQLMKAFKND